MGTAFTYIDVLILRNRQKINLRAKSFFINQIAVLPVLQVTIKPIFYEAAYQKV